MQFESVIAREAAGLESLHGQLEHCLTLFDSTIDSFHQADDVGNVAATVADLATFFDRYEQPEVAATLYGSATAYTSIVMIANLPATIEQLRSVHGEPRFAECVAAGEAMELALAVQYACGQIQHTRLRHFGATDLPHNLGPPSLSTRGRSAVRRRARSVVLHAAGRPPTRPLPGVDNQSCPVARLAQLWLPSRRTGHPRLLRVSQVSIAVTVSRRLGVVPAGPFRGHERESVRQR